MLRGIFTLSARELSWFYEGAGADMIHPELWEDFLSAAGPGVGPGGLIERYHELLSDPDPAVHRPAAIAWSTWEAATSTLVRDEAHIAQAQEARQAVAFARIENHFFRHGGWMDDGRLISDAGILSEHSIPGVIVHGRYDVVCPLATAWALHRAWPEAQWHVSPTAGHAFDEPETLSTLIEATDRFAVELAGQLRPGT